MSTTNDQGRVDDSVWEIRAAYIEISVLTRKLAALDRGEADYDSLAAGVREAIAKVETRIETMLDELEALVGE